jgi:enolase-phosphatase E1
MIKSWKGQNIKVFTFSSGSIEGQRSYFEYSSIGDASKYLDGHISSSVAMLDKFDTACYAKVSLITGEERNQILMLTNSTAEAKAAAIAGIPSVIVERENNNCVVSEEAKYFTRITKLTDLQFKAR